MQLATRRMLLRSSPLAPCRRCVAPLSVRAFKEEHEVKHEKPEPEKLEFTREEAPGKPVTPPPVTPRADLAAPFRMRSLFDEMEKEVEQLTRTFEELSPFPFPRRRRLVDPFESVLSILPSATERASMGMGMMRLATDVHEDDKAFTIKADVPGMTKDDIKVTLDKGMLTITGERKQEKMEKEEGTDKVRWMERSHGKFYRSFSLPEDADVDHISATIKDGVMTLVIPKLPTPPKPPVKEIPIVE